MPAAPFDIVAVEIGMAFSGLVNLISAEGHSRMPVYRETLDDVCGMVHIKDVLAWRGKSGNGFSLGFAGFISPVRTV